MSYSIVKLSDSKKSFYAVALDYMIIKQVESLVEAVKYVETLTTKFHVKDTDKKIEIWVNDGKVCMTKSTTTNKFIKNSLGQNFFDSLFQITNTIEAIFLFLSAFVFACVKQNVESVILKAKIEDYFIVVLFSIFSFLVVFVDFL